MKLIKYTTAAVLLSGAASAQGLFDVNPYEDESESLPLTYTVGLTFGYDDNVNPSSGQSEEDSSFVKASVTAGVVVRNAQTSWDLKIGLASTYYFEDVTNNDTTSNANLAFNLNHRINDRTRLVSRNLYNYGLDLGSSFGATTGRRNDEFTYFSTDNAIGYRWTDRLATYTGISYSILDYEDSGSDVDSLSFYNQFRYSLDSQTVLTAQGRFTTSEFDGDRGNSNRVTASVGFERRLNDTSSILLDVGVDIGDEETSPHATATYIKQVNTQLKARVFARYSQEDTDTVFLGDRYEDKTTFRLGAAVDYQLSPQIKLTLGGNYTASDYEGAETLADGDWDLFNVYVQASYKISHATSLRASINYTDSDATTIPNRDYDRTRYEIGVNYVF